MNENLPDIEGKEWGIKNFLLSRFELKKKIHLFSHFVSFSAGITYEDEYEYIAFTLDWESLKKKDFEKCLIYHYHQ